MELHYYQKDAVTATVRALREGLNPVVQLPTGAGKSLIIAHLAAKFAAKGGRMLVLTHVKELVDQNEATLRRYSPGTPAGVVCAGLGRDEPDAPVVFASIQSVFKRAEYFKAANTNLVAVDEAHLVPPDGEGLMYNRFLRELDARRLGLSATPWRLDGGAIYGPERHFDALAYQLPALELVQQGYLAPLRGVETAWQLDTSKLKKIAGDYSQSAAGAVMGVSGWLGSAFENAKPHLKGRKHVLVFCPSVETAQKATDWLNAHGETAAFVTADSPDRDDTLGAWKAGEFRFMCNVDILTTGFNFPALDAIVCLRPTQSSALWVQMLGRGMRVAADKADCLVLDYVGNLARLGGVDTMETWTKEKTKGDSTQDGTPKANTAKRRNLAALSLQSIDPMLGSAAGIVVEVLKCTYVVRGSARHPGKSLLMAVYDCESVEGVSLAVTQFVCVEYENGARWHAEQWARRRGYNPSNAFPRDAQRARIECYALPTPRKLQVRRVDGHLNVLREIF